MFSVEAGLNFDLCGLTLDQCLIRVFAVLLGVALPASRMLFPVMKLSCVKALFLPWGPGTRVLIRATSIGSWY